MGFWLCRGGFWQSRSTEGEGWDGVLTRPTSTSLVIITMLEQCSCHTMRQKSYTISCLGPAGWRKGHRGWMDSTGGTGTQQHHDATAFPFLPLWH